MRLGRYLRLYSVFLHNCFVREAEFRANFWANVLTNAGWLFFFVALIKVIYLNTRAIGTWSEAETIVLTGTYGLVRGVFEVVAYQNLSRLPELIRLGTLDFVVTKPVDSQFLVSTRYVKVDSVGNLLGAGAVVAYGLSLGHRFPGPAEWAAWGYLSLCALLIYYGIYMLVMTLAFWLIRVENLAVLSDMVFHAGRYPIDIYSGWARGLFTYGIPLAFIASFPARALFGRAPGEWLILATLFAFGLTLASAAFWRLGLRAYGSASS